jgi:hypothetical protein
MWVFTKHSFISIVASENSPGYFMVQSRFPNHIERLFPDAHVTIRYGLYRFRTALPKHIVSQKLLDIAEGIDYQDFKNSIPDQHYQTACRDVWATLDKYTPGASKPNELDELKP